MSRVYQEIDARVEAFLSRPLESSGYAYLYLDATYLHGRQLQGCVWQRCPTLSVRLGNRCGTRGPTQGAQIQQQSH